MMPFSIGSIAERGRRWTAILSNAEPGVATLVVEIADGSHVGFCSGSASARDADVPDDTAEISLVYVAPAHQRKDIGRTLLEPALEQLRGDGVGAVIVWVLARQPCRAQVLRRSWLRTRRSYQRPSRSDRSSKAKVWRKSGCAAIYKPPKR